jgi:hypothetical protein
MELITVYRLEKKECSSIEAGDSMDRNKALR